tara:strand:+ start:2668 stop:3015 length:348 start_codon:yes stop_codon:yes gene_type:complete
LFGGVKSVRYFYGMSNTKQHIMTKDLQTAAARYEAATHAKKEAVALRTAFFKNFRTEFGCLVTDENLASHNKTKEHKRLTEYQRAAVEELKDAQRELLFVASNGAAVTMYRGRVK